MRSFLALTLCVLLSFPFVSCDGSDEEEIPQTPEEEQTENPDENGNENGSENGDILIVYFSRTGYNYPNTWLDVGHTARVAEYIADYTGAASFEIVPSVPYPDGYDETTAIARQEIDNNARPAIKNELTDLDNYSIVFVGSPIWYGTPPMIMRTFFDTYDLSDKTIVPFCTHAGSGMGNTVSVIRSVFPDATMLDGLAVRGTDSPNARNTVTDWLQRIGFTETEY